MPDQKTNLLIVLLCVLFACEQEQPTTVISSDYAHHFVASTINLDVDTSFVTLEDYFEDPNKIDSLIGPEGLSFQFIEEKKELLLIPNASLAPLSVLEFHYENQSIFIPVKKSKKKKIIFDFDPSGITYDSVQLVGDINAWNPANTPLSFDGEKWTTDLTLLPGIYQYQVVLNGGWMLDPNNSIKLDNGIGGWNSKLEVAGEDQTLIPSIYTNSFAKNSIDIGFEGEVDGVIALWQNEQLPFVKSNKQFSVSLPDVSKGMHRSFVRVQAYSKYGLSNELLIPLDQGVPVRDASLLTRKDKATTISYFLLVDRFENGAIENDAPLNDPDVHPRADYHGGDIEGVLKKLEDGYFERLGINTIWLSPLVQNPEGAYGLFDKEGVKSKFSAYHGYWPISFTKIDDRFGSDKAFDELVKKAHAKDMNVFIDFVANHVHEEHPVYQKNKDANWTTNLYLPDGSLNTEKWDEHRLTTWFDLFLPTLNLEKEEVAEMLSDSALYWVQRYNVDGFRHDAAKHIPNNFWRMLSRKMKKHSVANDKVITQIGETYGTPELINSYINTGMLDGQFDFNVFDALLQALCKEEGSFKTLEQRLTQSFEYYGVNNLMGYISGNQDRPRFMALATGDVKFDEDSKLAGWKREINDRTPEGFAKLKLMNSILLTIPGVPVIFYGDEIGMTGGNDPDCRRMMRFDDLTTEEELLREGLAKMAHMRRNNMAFLYGDFTFLNVDDDLLAFSRAYFDELVIVLVNKGNEELDVELPLPVHYITEELTSSFPGEFSITDNILSAKLPALSIQVIK